MGHRPCKYLLPHGVSMRSQLPSGHIHLLQFGVLYGLQVVICSTMDLRGLQGHSLLHHGLHHKLQGNLCSSAWSTSSPFFFTDLGVNRVVALTYSYSSVTAAAPFLAFLKYVITKAKPALFYCKQSRIALKLRKRVADEKQEQEHFPVELSYVSSKTMV